MNKLECMRLSSTLQTGIMQQSLRMAKQEVVKHIRWRATSTDHTVMENLPKLSLKKPAVKMKVLYPELFVYFLK